jgi:uncharacterized protein (TIGR02466 family)
MSIKNISTETMYHFTAPAEILETALRKVKKIKFFDNNHNKISYSKKIIDHKDTSRQTEEHDVGPNANLIHNIDFKDLHVWFQYCIDRAMKDLNFKQNLKIVHSWANKSKKGERHHAHVHPLSFMSGVFYLTSSESGQTYYKYPPPSWGKTILTYNDATYHWEKPEAGKLVLFPSNIVHGVEENEDDKPRYTIAFDCFPDGILGITNDDALPLAIKILDYSS